MKLKLLFVAFLIATLAMVVEAAACMTEELHIPDTAAAEAYRKSQIELHSMVATAYCLNGTTATGTQTRSGIAASKREWFGKTVRVYWNDGGQAGSLIGEYVIEDTGGRPIRNGSVIDIWMPTKEECMQFGRRCVLVEVLE